MLLLKYENGDHRLTVEHQKTKLWVADTGPTSKEQSSAVKYEQRHDDQPPFVEDGLATRTIEYSGRTTKATNDTVDNRQTKKRTSIQANLGNKGNERGWR